MIDILFLIGFFAEPTCFTHNTRNANSIFATSQSVRSCPPSPVDHPWNLRPLTCFCAEAERRALQPRLHNIGTLIIRMA